MGRSNVASISGLETAEGRLEPEADSDQNNNVQDFKTYDTKWRINIHLYTIIYYHLLSFTGYVDVHSGLFHSLNTHNINTSLPFRFTS
jgi:hypothetical protein